MKSKIKKEEEEKEAENKCFKLFISILFLFLLASSQQFHHRDPINNIPTNFLSYQEVILKIILDIYKVKSA